jgi:hypothetical protein
MDDAYFAPLRTVQRRPGTELFLGLVHHTVGLERTRRRPEAAQQTMTDLGVATECGLGHRPPETILDLLAIHAAVAAPVA